MSVALLLASCGQAKSSGSSATADAHARLSTSYSAHTRPTLAASAAETHRGSIPPAPHGAAPEPGQQVAVAAGTLLAGSRPGVAGRDPKVEADLAPVTVPAFHIDRLPYPNDPSRPALVGVSRAKAAAMCAAEGKRLCHELEWERACRGDTSNDWPTGAFFDAAQCNREPMTCDSPLGVSMMGVVGAEWTSSGPSRGLGDATRSAVVRGASASADPAAHRCGARRALSPTEAPADLAFRCCTGDAPTLDYPDVGFATRFRQRPLTSAEAQAILVQVPELAPYASDFRPFTSEEIDRALSAGGQRRDTLNGWEIAEGLLRWSPRPGDEAWVLTGRGGGSSLLAVVYPLANGGFLHAASFVLKNETSPIALAFTPPSRGQLLWSSCWGCPGDDGSVDLRDDGTLTVAHR